MWKWLARLWMWNWLVGPLLRKPTVPDVNDYVRTLQKDGRLLLRHLARRSDAALPDTAYHGSSSSNILFANPDEVAQDRQAIAELVCCVDGLSRCAAPSNVRSIRLTYAYLGMAPEGGEPPKFIKAEARRVRRYMWSVGGVAALLFIASIALLSHADYGRRLLQQLADLRQQEQKLIAEMIAVPFKDTALRGPAPKAGASLRQKVAAVAPQGGSDSGSRLCAPRTEGASWLEPKTAKAADLCRRDKDLEVRLALTYVALADWNCLTSKGLHVVLHPLSTVLHPFDSLASVCEPAQQKDLLSENQHGAWKSHEIRTSNMIGVIGGFVLPMMLGCLGGCAYVGRELNDKLKTWRLEPNDGMRAVVRVGLAALLGGLVGVVWTSDKTLELGGLTLSLAAVAFFIGFSVEAVFRLIESVTNTVLSGFQTQTANGAPPLPPVMPQLTLRRREDTATAEVAPALPNPDTASATPEQTRLIEMRQELTDQRQSLAALAAVDSGSPVAPGAPAVIARIDQTLRSIEPLLNGTPDPARLSTAVGEVEKAVQLAQNSGLPGVLADAAATLQGALDFARPVLLGIPGGPVGMIGGIVLGGLRLYENQQQFQALKSALLKKPFDPTLPRSVPDDTTALAALDASPLMLARLPQAHDPRFANTLMQALLARHSDGTPKQAGELVAELMRPDNAWQIDLSQHFDTPTELALAIDEYRSGIVFTEALKRFSGSVTLPKIGHGEGQQLDLQKLARAVVEAHADPHAFSAIERVVALTEGLAGQPAGPQAAVELVTRALEMVPGIIQTSRATGEA